MGAEEFTVVGRGASPIMAFAAVRDEALYEEGHGGYSGTIAEKGEIVMIEVPEGRDPHEYAEELLETDDERVTDKWGPAGCIELEDGSYLFFGLASS